MGTPRRVWLVLRSSFLRSSSVFLQVLLVVSVVVGPGGRPSARWLASRGRDDHLLSVAGASPAHLMLPSPVAGRWSASPFPSHPSILRRPDRRVARVMVAVARTG